MVISSISSSYRTYNIGYVTRGPLLVDPTPEAVKERCSSQLVELCQLNCASQLPSQLGPWR